MLLMDLIQIYACETMAGLLASDSAHIFHVNRVPSCVIGMIKAYSMRLVSMGLHTACVLQSGTIDSEVTAAPAAVSGLCV